MILRYNIAFVLRNQSIVTSKLPFVTGKTFDCRLGQKNYNPNLLFGPQCQQQFIRASLFDSKRGWWIGHRRYSPAWTTLL